jgi:inner membrane protein
MMAATVADLDGLSIIGGWEAFREYHHVFGHNLLVSVVAAVGFAAFSTQRVKGFLLFLGLAHLHLLLDFYGSGPLWKIYYWWPFDERGWMTDRAWEFYSWQNISTAVVLLGWTVWIAARQGRTPLEAVMPSLDKQLVELARRKLPWITLRPARGFEVVSDPSSSDSLPATGVGSGRTDSRA